MEYRTIEVEREGRVGIIRFNRPEVMNAMNGRLYAEWIDALDAFNADDSIGAVVSTGKGRAYSAGADIGGFERSFTGGADPEDIRPPHGAFEAEYLSKSKPLIAAVNGVAVGVGLTSILWFDRIVASTEARFSMRFAAIGLTPELNSQWMLPRMIGMHNAKEMMLTGRIYSAQEAKDLGLVRHVVPPEELMPFAIGLAAEIAANPISVLRTIKREIYDDLVMPDMLAAEKRSTHEFMEARKTAEHREALLALREKRAARFHDAEHMEEVRRSIAAPAS
ncbi:MAG: enoyl-CoA hydratase/isomerase family protein [Tepidiformaceae bacterium]